MELAVDRWLVPGRAAVALAAAIALAFVVVKSGAVSDFAVFWTAQHLAHPYDFVELSRAIGPKTTYFPYPPTFLLLTVPLGWLSLPAANFVWITVSATAIVACGRRLWAPLILASPAVFMAGMIGQTSLIMGALVFAATTLRRRPILSGVCLAIAACIKPQIVVLIPIALAAAGQWRMLASTAATGLLLCALSALAYGPQLWLDWLLSLPGFLRFNDLKFTGRYIAVPGNWRVVVLVAGGCVAWLAGRAGEVERGVFVAVATALLGSLHAMDYDAAILAPFVFTAARRDRWTALGCVAALAIPPSTWSVLAFLALKCAAADERPPTSGALAIVTE